MRVVLTGGPGSGKTAVLDALSKRGYETGDDAARSIIRERKLAELTPRPDAAEFAQQVFEKEVMAYKSLKSAPTFFERGVVDATGSLIGAGVKNADEARELLEQYRYQSVFIFPPWEAIYCQDDERDHTYKHAVKVYHSTLEFYRWCGYQPIEVPLEAVEKRVQFILGHVLDA